MAKTNVLTFAHDLWMRTFTEVSRDFPELKADYNHVDACCMRMVLNPERYDVIVTTNMFGDIITDLGAVLQGGMGLAASGNLNPTRAYPSMFEPVHGSAPDIAGQGDGQPGGGDPVGRNDAGSPGNEGGSRRGQAGRWPRCWPPGRPARRTWEAARPRRKWAERFATPWDKRRRDA